MKYFFIALLLILVQTEVLKAQIHFETLNTRNGLSQNTVLAICQDSLGFMWFGTREDGLNRYDGKTFTYFNHKSEDFNSISSNRITQLLAGEDGSMWIGTDHCLDYYNPINSTIRKATYKTSNGVVYSFEKQEILSLKKETDGTIWVLTTQGLFSKRTNSNFFRELILPKVSRITALEPLSDSKFIIASGKFIYYYDAKANILERNNLVDSSKFKNIHLISKDNLGNLFFGSLTNGFAVYIKSKNQTYYFSSSNNQSLKNNVTRTFFREKNGKLYIGTFNGLYELNLESLALKGYFSDDKSNSGLSHNSVHSIFRDNAGNLWIGTFSGGINIKYATSYPFITYRHSNQEINSISSNIVNAFYKDNYGMWIGTDGGGLSLLEDNKFKNFQYSNISSHIKAIYKKDANHLWLGSHDLGAFDYGLELFNEQTGKVEQRLLQDYSIYDIQKDSSNVLWLAAAYKGLLFFNSNTLQLEKKIPIPEALKERVKVLGYLKKENIMLVCSLNSIFLYNFASKRFIELPKTPIKGSIHEINDLFIDSTDNIWIGSSNGLFKITDLNVNNGNCKIQQFTLQSLNVKSINEGNDDNIWVSSFKGLSSISKDLTQFQSYHQQYRIQGNEFINQSSYRSIDDKLWFGGNEGFTTFDPSKLGRNTFIPPLVFTKIEIDNQEYFPKAKADSSIENITFKKRIDLDYWQKNITLTVAGLNYIIPSKNKYKWTLSSDGKIVIQGNTSVININNLDPKKYLLSVKASNNDGVWVTKPLELEIYISPPWWNSNLAYITYFIIGLSVTIISFRIYNERKNILHKLELEKLEKQKEKELHEEKLTFFTNISHEIKTPLTLISGPISHALSLSKNEDVKKNLTLAEKNTTYLKELVDQLLDFRKIEKNAKKIKLTLTDLNFFISNICASFSESTTAHTLPPIEYSSSYNHKVYVDRDILNKIVRNLISNAIKYNKDGHPILVSLGEKPLPQNPMFQNSFTVGKLIKASKKIIITVEDSGIGITENSLPKIFKRFFQIDDPENKHLGSGIGLSLVKSLVLLHKGKMKVESERNYGTRFTVTLPIDKEAYSYTDFDSVIEKESEEDKHIPHNEIKKNVAKAKTTILLIDDNKELQDWMVSFLSNKFKCITAENGKKGVSLAKKENPDIIISDVMMPKMNGFELCRVLKNEVNTSHIPIILLTAKTIEDDEKEGYISGANAYIKKPFSPEILVRTIENFIDLKNTIVEKYNANYKDSSLIEKLSVYDRKIIDLANNYIESNIADTDMNVENMASALAMSRSSLFRKIKTITNSSPNEYIKNYRLTIALELIKDRVHSINEIAEMVGFNDFYYFRKCFHQKFGVKPEHV